MAFYREVRSYPSVVAWVLQLILVYLANLLFPVILPDYQPWLPLLFDYICIAAFSACLAVGVRRIFGPVADVGRWIWLPPVLFVAWNSIGERLDQFLALFVPIPIPGGRMGEIGLVLVTFPTWGCCWYSAAMWIAGARYERGVSTVLHASNR